MAKMVDVLLVGGGHANVQVLKLLCNSASPKDRLRLTLISDYPSAYYSGMLPGCIAHLYKVGPNQARRGGLSKGLGAGSKEQKV